jgi:dTDP-glucose 4,6-dehydratase
MNVRDWLHVEDHCRGIELVIQKGRVGETYNIGGGQELPNLEVIEEICRTVDAAFQVDPSLCRRFPHAPAANGGKSETLKTFVTDRLGHDRRYAIDETKVRSELGYCPVRTFAEGFAETMAWYLANEAWWRPLAERAR